MGIQLVGVSSGGGAATLPGWVTGSLLTTGEEAIQRDACISNVIGLNTGIMRLCYFTARKSETTNQVRVVTGSTAAGATPTLCRIGLYEQTAADGSASLVASIANDTTLFAASGTAYTRSWSAPYAKVAGTRYAIGVLVVTAATAPNLLGQFLPIGSEVTTVQPPLAAALFSQTDLPASFSAPAAAGNRPYAAVLP